MPPNNPYVLEVCVETAQALEACTGIVDRVEICSGLEVGGLTPSYGLMQAAKKSGIETHALIRPKSGGFQFQTGDVQIVCDDIQAAKKLGLKGVVIGALTDDRLDIATLSKLVDTAGELDVTLHRAFDLVRDQSSALEQTIELGITRILTSGGAPSAIRGAHQIADVVTLAAGRIEIMAGAGINSENIGELAQLTGAKSFHASCTTVCALDDATRELGFGTTHRTIDPSEVQRMRARLNTLTENVPM